MTIVRLREQRSQAIEQRNMQTSWPMGNGWLDPAAIPPPGLFRMQRAGVVVTQHTLLQVDVVFTALRLITNAILLMGDPYAYEEALWKPENIPYQKRLAEQPEVLTDTWGGMLFQYDGRRRTVMSMGLFGEAFWYVLDQDKYLYPTALEVLHPAYMEVKADKQGNPIYKYGPANNQKVLDPEKVVHIPHMAMPSGRRALSPIEYAGVCGALAMAAYEFGSHWFSQGASPSFLLSTDQKLGQAEVDRIAEKFVIDHSGLSQSHLPLVLDNGLKASKVLNTPDEAQYLQTLEYARSAIANWFGVDEFVPNALERTTPPPPHTGQERVQRFITFTLSGYTLPMAEAYASLLPKKQRAAFDHTRLSQVDPQFLAQEMMAVRQTQAGSSNDLRVRYKGWGPLDDPAADEAIAPLASNVAPSQTPSPMGSGGEPKPKDEGT